MDGSVLEVLCPIRRTGRDGVSSRRDHAVFGGIRRDTQSTTSFQLCGSVNLTHP